MLSLIQYTSSVYVIWYLVCNFMGQKSGLYISLNKQRSQLPFVESWPLSCECLGTICHFTRVEIGNASLIDLSTNEGHSWARSKLDIGDPPRICAPIHGTCDHMAVTKNPFNQGYMSQTIGSLYPRLQVYNRPHCW